MSGAAEFDRLLELEENWDSYGAEKIDPRAVVAAKKMLDPRVVPTNPGGVLVEYRWPDGTKLEIEWSRDGRIESICWERGG